ncbi:AMP binding protein [Meredithblackwellia eburnea MCA 4105]
MTVIKSPYPDVELPVTSLYNHVWSNPHNISSNKVAIIDAPTGRSFTRGELQKATRVLAHGLLNKAGVIPGKSVVAVFSPNSLYYHLIVLGAQAAGAIVTTANPHYEPTELRHQLKDSGAALAFVHPECLLVALKATKLLGWSISQQKQRIILAVQRDEVGPEGKEYRTFDDLMFGGKEVEPFVVRNPKEEVAYLTYSSGTSGLAKGVKMSHFNVTSVVNILKPFDVNQEDTMIVVLPLNHIYGLTKALHYPIYHGTTLVVLPSFNLETFCSAVQKYRGTVSLLVPPVCLLLAREKVVDNYDLSSLRLVVSGAAPLGAELEGQLAKRLGCGIAQAYGLSEMSPSSHYCPLATPKSGSIGPLLPNLRARVRDPVTGNDVATGEPGELLLQGPNMMLGYLNRPKETAETFLEDADGIWLRTGDIGYCDEQGFWFITDRLKELIKYKGSQVAPAELEAVLLDCPFVADAGVIGIWEEEQATELPRAYVVLSEAGQSERDPPSAIRGWVDSRVARHKKLRGGVFVIEVIPKSPSGKILRRILRERAKADTDAVRSSLAARAKL